MDIWKENRKAADPAAVLNINHGRVPMAAGLGGGAAGHGIPSLHAMTRVSAEQKVQEESGT
ncbi:hypothetical protein N7504_006203 [Penicillium tannophilum]|nr:hypothetical protein N7504_006203 [Penicillium tannophilum]